MDHMLLMYSHLQEIYTEKLPLHYRGRCFSFISNKHCNHAHTYFWRFFCVPLHSLNTAPVCFLCSLNRTGQPLSQGSSAALSVLQPPQSEKRGPLVYLKSLSKSSHHMQLSHCVRSQGLMGIFRQGEPCSSLWYIVVSFSCAPCPLMMCL